MTDLAKVSVENAEQVNIDQAREAIPHIRVVTGVTFFVLVGFAGVTAFALAFSRDATIIGAIIGTWTAMATAAVGFWLGASSGGKLKR